MQNIENSHDFFSLMLCKMSLNCTEIGYINDTVDYEISYLAIPLDKQRGSGQLFQKMGRISIPSDVHRR